MKTIIDEILTEWNDRLGCIVEKQKIFRSQCNKLESIRKNFIFIRKFFTPVEKPPKRVKKTSKVTVLNKSNVENIVFTERQQQIIKTKCPSLTDLSKVKEVNIVKKDETKEPEDPFGVVDDKENQPTNKIQSVSKVQPVVDVDKENINNERVKKEVQAVSENVPKSKKNISENVPKSKKNIKNLLEGLKSKSKKKVEQNKENIMDQTIIIEDGEIKLFKNKEKKRLKEYLKESKKKQKDEPKVLKQKKAPFDMVYDVGTNQFISSTPPENEKEISPNVSPVKSSNKLKSWKKDTSIKDGLYKQIIDMEISKSRSLMNSYKPRSTIPEISSDDEDSYVTPFADEQEINRLIVKQNHEEIEKYFSTDLTIDIEMLFPNIKDISNSSPNKWE